MLALVLLLVICTALQSHSLPALVQYQAKDELGQYRYGYSGGPSAKQEERTLDGVTRGSYSFIDGNGLVQTRSYEADDLHGFRVVGTDIAAPTGVSTKGTILLSSGTLPVAEHARVYETYAPVTYRGYEGTTSISGNEISIAPASIQKTITTTSVPISPYSSALQYLKSPYRYKLSPTTYTTAKYYQPQYVTKRLEVSPQSSVGLRYPTSSYSEPARAIVYTDLLNGIQSTASPPVQTVYSSELPVATATVATPVSIPVRSSVSYTPTYQSSPSQLVRTYSPKYTASVQPIAYRSSSPLAITNSVPSSVTYTNPASSASFATAVAINNPIPAPIASSDAASYPIGNSSPVAVTYTNAIPAVEYTKAVPAAEYTKPIPTVEYTKAVPAVEYAVPAVTYTKAVPAVKYTSSSPAVTYASAAPAVTYSSGTSAVTYDSAAPLYYGYYPTTSNFFRYASAAPSLRASVYEPAGGYTAAKPVPLQEAIATQYHAQDELGQYRYGYSNINSAKEETKTVDGVTRGSFSYVDANGVLQSRSYISDDVSGFRVIGTDIPKDPNGHVNPDAIPSQHVSPAVAAGDTVVHSQPIIAATTVPDQVMSYNTPVVELNTPYVVSSTPATLVNLIK